VSTFVSFGIANKYIEKSCLHSSQTRKFTSTLNKFNNEKPILKIERHNTKEQYMKPPCNRATFFLEAVYHFSILILFSSILSIYFTALFGFQGFFHMLDLRSDTVGWFYLACHSSLRQCRRFITLVRVNLPIWPIELICFALFFTSFSSFI